MKKHFAKKILIAVGLLLGSNVSMGQTFDFDLSRSIPSYTDSAGYGYDITDVPSKKSNLPFYFSVKVPDGNYKIRVVLGSKSKNSNTTVRAESRRLMVENVNLKKGKFATYEFVVNKRTPYINEKMQVKIKPREKSTLTWDNKLTLEFTGSSPAVKSIHIEKDDVCPTIYLCGNSTVTDQSYEPWASWGQMVTRWFNENVSIANYAESGLTAGSFIAQNRLAQM